MAIKQTSLTQPSQTHDRSRSSVIMMYLNRMRQDSRTECDLIIDRIRSEALFLSPSARFTKQQYREYRRHTARTVQLSGLFGNRFISATNLCVSGEVGDLSSGNFRGVEYASVGSYGRWTVGHRHVVYQWCVVGELVVLRIRSVPEGISHRLVIILSEMCSFSGGDLGGVPGH
jgi:hypothetical protein